MTLDSLFPIAGDHAIQNAVFILEWKDHSEERRLKEARNAVQQRLQRFSNIRPNQQIFIELSNGSTGPVPGQSTMQNGYVFEIPGGPMAPSRRSMNVTKENIQIVISDYSKWEKVFADIKSYFGVLFAQFANQRISSIGLQYTDVFIWKDSVRSLDLKKIFNVGTPYIAANVFDVSGPWHSHNGFFASMDLPGHKKRLENINVSFSESTSGDLAFNIVISHKLDFESPERANAAEMWEKIEPIYQCFHKSNKDILLSLLTKEVSEKINLKKEV